MNLENEPAGVRAVAGSRQSEPDPVAGMIRQSVQHHLCTPPGIPPLAEKPDEVDGITGAVVAGHVVLTVALSDGASRRFLVETREIT